MTQSLSFPLLQHKAFQQLSEAGAKRLEAEGRGLKFELGQQLCQPSSIPARILVLLKGRARLVGTHNGRLTTVGKFGPGSVVGAASLMSGAACENVIASEEVLAWSIPDHLWIDLYSSEESFRTWCDQQLWPQELFQLLEILDQGAAVADSSPLEQLEASLSQAKRCPPTQIAIEEALKQGWSLYLSSSWGDATLGRVVQSMDDLPAAERFAHRVVAFPPQSALITRAQGEELIPSDRVENADPLPPISSYSPERNVVDNLSLIQAEGPIEETLACFQMLSQLMKLPFRRDSIEKVLQDNIRRGLTPNLQLCGQLASSLGLHVMAARVPAVAGSRLQVPSMLPWQGGFALVVSSNEKGLRLASPRQGIVSLDPDELESSFPDGIELLLMERSNATPDQKFGPAWFWPALRRYRSVLIQVLAASFVVRA